MEIQLKRNLELVAYDVVMEIGISASRPDIIAVLKLVEEHDEVSPSLIVSHLLGDNYPESVGERIITRCEELGLLDSDGELTEQATEAIESGIVFLPERSTYTVWFTKDPLFYQGFIAYRVKNDERLHDVVGRDYKSGQYKRAKTSDDFSEIPDWMQEWLERFSFTALAVYGKKDTMAVFDISEKCLESNAKLDLSIHLTLADDGSSEYWIDGPQGVDPFESPEIGFSDVWPAILGDSKSKWDKDIYALRLKYDEINKKHKSSFKNDREVVKPMLEGFGEFDSITIKDVPIAPARKTDARIWARDMLKDNISGYITDDSYGKIKKELITRFSSFKYSSRDLGLPEQDELAKEILSESQKDGIRPESYWYLQAPLDLNPWGVEE